MCAGSGGRTEGGVSWWGQAEAERKAGRDEEKRKNVGVRMEENKRKDSNEDSGETTETKREESNGDRECCPAPQLWRAGGLCTAK